MSRHPVFERLARGQSIVLDGDIAHELGRRGYRPTGALGDAAAAREVPAMLAEVHRAFADAGSDVLLAFTARTSVRTLARGGFGMRAAALTNQAVDIALEAAQGAGRPVAVAGVLGALDDAAPELASQVSTRQLADEHAEQAQRLAVAGCDAVVVAAMPTLRETLAATSAARRVKEPVWTVLAVRDEALASSDAQQELVTSAGLIVAAGAQMVLLEARGASELTAALDMLHGAGLGVPLGARLSRERADDDAPTASTPAGTDRFAGELLSTVRHGARALGGAPGIGVDEIRALAHAVRQRVAA